ADGYVEAHLVVAGARAAVGHGVRAQLERHAHDRLGLRRALAAHGDGIDAAAQHVALDEVRDEAPPDVGARVHRAVLAHAEGPRARLDRGQRLLREAAGVHGHGHDVRAVALAQPRGAEAGVESAGEGEDDGLHAGPPGRRAPARAYAHK